MVGHHELDLMEFIVAGRCCKINILQIVLSRYSELLFNIYFSLIEICFKATGQRFYAF